MKDNERELKNTQMNDGMNGRINEWRNKQINNEINKLTNEQKNELISSENCSPILSLCKSFTCLLIFR